MRSIVSILPQLLASAVLVACTGLSQNATAQTTYYVAPCGDDSWTGLSDDCRGPNGPKATIQAAIDATVSGDAVWMAAGT